MAHRHKMTRSGSQKQFQRNSGVHPKNTVGAPMRGGIRL